MIVFTQYTDHYLHYRQAFWLNITKKFKRRIRRKKITQTMQSTTKKDYSLLYILIIILNLAIYMIHLDVMEEILIY